MNSRRISFLLPLLETTCIAKIVIIRAVLKRLPKVKYRIFGIFDTCQASICNISWDFCNLLWHPIVDNELLVIKAGIDHTLEERHGHLVLPLTLESRYDDWVQLLVISGKIKLLESWEG
jgi:hypothetical protein